MNRRLAASMSALAVLTATSAIAGERWTYSLCQKNADGSGQCYGTVEAFRHSPQPKQSMDFRMGSSTGASIDDYTFSAVFNGENYGCTANSTVPAIVQMWPVAMNNRGYFQVKWNASGICYFLSLDSGSATHDN